MKPEIRFNTFAGVLLTTILLFVVQTDTLQAENQPQKNTVCPPFYLMDENGAVIDPVNNINTGKPYSPKQTCGQCHDYEKITSGFHFMQGKGEQPTATQTERCQWALTPGNYGGLWCSPAPLYRYLSPKENDNSDEMDMTSFSFITAGCGACHPGGGSMETDRNGNRYDEHMYNAGYTSGGVNNFDGDYYQARWTETGVLEADCMICHQPSYSYDERNRQLAKLNFRWAPTAAAQWAVVSGSVQEGVPVQVSYNMSAFGADGKISPDIVREPRTQACTNCHAQPGWKKRGANYSERTDVHLRAGLKCVDCHPAGSMAFDPRINEREMHQFAKGDDPGGLARNDLDNTMLDCEYCHSNGHLGAPIAKHKWLPPLHLDKVACQTCHIPQRTVKAAQVQAGDVFNPDTKIPSKGKHLWTFYGPDMQYYNHYGNLTMIGFDDKPTDIYTPTLAKYNGKIYPVNRVHSIWPGIQTEGKPGLMQPRMSDIYNMWATFRANPETYTQLAKIVDDNGDGVIEINNEEEIDALIEAVTKMLLDIHYPMTGKRVVWVMNDRVYSSGKDYTTIDKHSWEASPYANVHKYNHDVFPARSALGMNGCNDCHAGDSQFFYNQALVYPFDANANPVTQPQYKLMGLSGFETALGVWRETGLKTILYVLLLLLILFPLTLALEFFAKWVFGDKFIPATFKYLPAFITLIIAFAILIFSRFPDIAFFIVPSRFWLDSHHFAIAMLIFIAGIIALGSQARIVMQNKENKGKNPVLWELLIAGILLIVSGLFMFAKLPGLDPVTRVSYTVFDLSLVLVLIGTLVTFYRRQFTAPGLITE